MKWTNKILQARTRQCKKASHLLDVAQADQAPTFAGGLDNLGLWIQTFGEVLVTAALPTGTHLRVALVLQHAVQALRLKPTRPLARWLAVTFGDLRNVCGVHLNLADRFVDLKGGGRITFFNNKIKCERTCFIPHYGKAKFIIHSFLRCSTPYTHGCISATSTHKQPFFLFLNGQIFCFYFERSLTTWKCKTVDCWLLSNKIKRGKTNIWIFLVHMKTHKLFMKILKFHSCNSVLVDRCLDIKTFHTLINLYGGGLRLFSCASLASRFIFISLNRVSASSRAEEDKTEQSMSTSS